MNLPPRLSALHAERLLQLSNPKYHGAHRALEAMDAGSADSVWSTARALMPWKKGPFAHQGRVLDAEWDCRQKWQRLAPHLGDLSGKRVLDLGCNNGWYMQKLREAHALEVIGFDPMQLNLLQWRWAQALTPDPQQEFYLLGVEDLPDLPASFDVILSFGVLYHHRSPLQQLIDLRESLVPGGTLYLETIGVPGTESNLLLPPDRYANMPNVWFLPTLPALLTMLERTRFTGIEVLATEWGREKEQRSTEWTTGPSYRDVLDPKDPTRTIEGLPAPERFLLKAHRKALG